MTNLESEASVILAEIAEIKELLKMVIHGKDTFEMYTITQACEALKISRTTFDRYANMGKILTIKVMGKKYVTHEQIQAYLGR